jgi:hypothetical protein
MALKSTRIKMTGTARERTSPGAPQKLATAARSCRARKMGTAITQGIDTCKPPSSMEPISR